MEGVRAAKAREILAGVVSEDLLNAYCVLIADGELSVGEAERLFGGSMVQALHDRGMAHRWSNSQRIVPVAPDLALHAALIELQRELMANHQRLATGHERLAEASRVLVGEAGFAEDMVRVVTDHEEITNLSYSLINLARRDWMTLENLLRDIPLDEASVVAPLPVFDGQVVCRAIYEERFLDHPAGRMNVEASIAAGEEARFLPHIGMKFQMADESAALLPLTPTGMGGALLVKCPAIVSSLREYFEILWSHALPIGGEAEDRTGLSDLHRRILKMMNVGLQDEAIANRLDMSVHTVRRHITTMREMLDVESRFGMGAAAVRRGWL